MPCKLTTQEFVEKAIEIHGDKYDYSEVVYINSRTKVKIICPIHGAFWQTPNSHLNGVGCRECSIEEKKITKEQVIEDIINIHGDVFDFSEFEYYGLNTKSIFVCKICGHKWHVKPKEIKDKHGCPSCDGQLPWTINLLQEASNKVHDSKYTILTEPSGANNNVEIECSICGNIFQQIPNYHINGKGGCSNCSGNLSWTLKGLQERSNEIHNGKYTILTEPNGKDQYFEIECNCGNIFKQTPHNHTNGKGGCCLCARENNLGSYCKTYFERYPEEWYKLGILYLVKLFINNDEYIKIGITKRTAKERFYGFGHKVIKEIPMPLGQAFEIEQKILNNYSLIKKRTKKTFTGYTECFELESYDDLIKYFEEEEIKHENQRVV